MSLTRRELIIRSAAGAALGLAVSAFGIGWPGAAFAQDEGPSHVDVDTLMKAGPEKERAMGEPDAPITVIEYASMTCTHCAHFDKETFPKLKEQYIDTGKVYYILREFPLDPVATAAFMLARCLPDEDKYFPFVDALFKTQNAWAFVDNPEQGLFRMAQQAGFTKEKFESCLTNQDILDRVNAVKKRAIDEFGVSSTPTFFINGDVVRGALPWEDFEKKLQEHMPS